VIHKLATGVPGLDEVLGGGIPEFSFNLIAGAPGTGKTTLAQQILFANATRERPGLFFTVLGEPPIKMLRYQQQFRFFDPARVGSDVHFLNLGEEVMERNLDVVLDRITADVERVNPSIVIVDSFRTVVRTADTRATELDLQHFVQRLALRLTSWEATTFLIGEFADGESRDPVFTVADGVVWLMNEVERNSTVRKLRVTKVRGQAAQAGLHTMRISDDGVEVYPRLPNFAGGTRRMPPKSRCSTGIPGLDAMMSGGIPDGDSVLVTGPTGTGKTILCTQFVAAGVAQGECAVIAVFEEHPDSYMERAKALGFDLAAMVDQGRLDVMYLRPLDLSVDETLQEIRTRVDRIGATRVVIDSLSGFEAALAPTFRQDFREAYHRLIVSLTALGVTVLSTVEIVETSDYLRFSPYNISFLADDIVAMRYVELEGELRKVIAVIKMRGSDHSRALHAYDVTSTGLVLRETLQEYRGIITGVPERRGER
jgi:circadian clock protein KaiC